MHKINFIPQFLIVIGLFVLFYNPPIFSFNSMHIVGGISICLLLAFYPKRFKKWMNYQGLAQKFTYLVLGIILIFVYGISVSVIGKGNMADSFAYAIYYLIDIIPFGALMIIYCSQKNFQSKDYYNLFLLTGYIQAILAVLAFFVEPIKIWLNERMAAYGYLSIDLIVAHRNYGFAGTLTFATPILQSILSLMAIYQGITQSKRYFLGAALLAFSAIINARTSLIVLFIGFFLLFLLSGLSLNKKMKIVIYGSLLFLIVALSFAFLNQYAPDTIAWIQEGIEEIFDAISGDVEEGTFAFLLNPDWYKLPSGFSVLWGTGHRVITGYNGYNSDIGYINDIWFGGIIYAAIKYFFIYSLIFYLMKHKSEGLIKYMGILFAVLMPILNIKGLAFDMNGFSNMIFILFLICISLSKYVEVHRRNIFESLTAEVNYG